MPTQTHTLETPDVDLVYDVTTPEDGAADPTRPTLLMIGHPMDAGGFATLASYFGDRTVVRYDPRGLGRSGRKDGREDRGPELHADDLHALIGALGGPVDVFGSSGGAVNGLALVATHPDDVHILVAHEPPLLNALPDAEQANAAGQAFLDAYQAKGFGAGMAGFMRFVSWRGEYTDAFLAEPLPDPAAFGLPTEDDGNRNDPLLDGSASGITAYRVDADALTAAPTRVVLGVGEESRGTMPARAGAATGEALGVAVVEFPSHHGGFTGGDGPYAGQPEAFAARLREVLDGP